MNHKRVERIWRQEGLRVPKEQRKRGRLWLNDGSCVRLRPAHEDHVWSYDFVQARTHDGRALRMLTVIDEHTRECLAIDVARSRKSDDVPERLAWLMATRGVPGHVRSDNGAECTAKAVRAWPRREWCELLLSRRLRPHPRSFATSCDSLRTQYAPADAEWLRLCSGVASAAALTAACSAARVHTAALSSWTPCAKTTGDPPMRSSAWWRSTAQTGRFRVLVLGVPSPNAAEAPAQSMTVARRNVSCFRPQAQGQPADHSER